MIELPYFHVDAFASRPFGGNQAAVIPLSGWLPDAVLQAIGEENNFAETAFIVPDSSGETDFELRWFTPTLEIALCGHATLAAGHVLLSQQRDMDEVRFRTRQAGVLVVERDHNGDHDGDGDGYAVGLPAYPPEAKAMPDIAALVGGAPVATAFHPGRYHVLHYASAAEVRALDPDMRGLKALGNAQFICTAPADAGDDHDVVSRVFVPGGGVDEDSVTGSAHAVLTPYWTQILGRDGFRAYQASARGGHLHCRLDGDTAWLGGQCVTVVEGIFRLATSH